MSVFEKENTVFFGYHVVYLCILAGLGFSSTFGHLPPHISPGVPPLGLQDAGMECYTLNFFCNLLSN